MTHSSGSRLVSEALMEVGSWNDPHLWPKPFRELIRYAKILHAEVRRLDAALFESEPVGARPLAAPAQLRDPGNPLQILRIREVSKLIGLGRGSIYQKVAEGTFPRPVKLGHRAVGWRLGEVEGWISGRKAE